MKEVKLMKSTFVLPNFTCEAAAPEVETEAEMAQSVDDIEASGAEVGGAGDDDEGSGAGEGGGEVGSDGEGSPLDTTPEKAEKDKKLIEVGKTAEEVASQNVASAGDASEEEEVATEERKDCPEECEKFEANELYEGQSFFSNNFFLQLN